MRIAIGGIMHESNTFASARTDRARFLEGSLAHGDAILPVWREAHHEMGGFIEGADRFGFTLVPTVMAWATPGGPVDDTVLDEVVEGIATGVREGQADGLLLALHGAMVTARHPDADAEVLRRVRAALGTDFPIIVTLDFHANVTPQMADLCQAMVGYQTYPHIDQRACGLKAAELIARTVRGEIRPVTVVDKPRMLINLLGQDTGREPMCSIMRTARELECQSHFREGKHSLLSISVMAGFPYADVPEMGTSVIVVSDGDRKQAEAVAPFLSQMLWQAREELHVACPGPEEAIRLAIVSDRKPVVLVDLGDNIGGGSAGDGTVLLSELIRQRARDAVVVVHDPEAEAEARQIGPGGSFEGLVGGKFDSLHGSPVLVRGIVRSLHDGTWTEDLPRHGGRRHNDQGPTVVIDLEGSNILVLNSLRTPPFSLGQLISLGIDPSRQSILVVKAAIAYKAAYAPIAGEVIEVDTPGLTAIDPARFEYKNIRRPLFPLDI